MTVYRAPYHETLVAFMGLCERQRIEGLIDHSRDVAQACRVNAAFAAPKELSKEQQQVRAALRKSAARESARNAADLVAQFAPLQPAE